MPNIEYLGLVPPDKAQQVIADAALLLSTSDGVEGFPNTFLQAWSSGTPVVSLKIDPNCIIERMGLGVISGNAGRAVLDITVLMNSSERRNEISARAVRYVAEAHNEAAVIRTFESATRDATAPVSVYQNSIASSDVRSCGDLLCTGTIHLGDHRRAFEELMISCLRTKK